MSIILMQKWIVSRSGIQKARFVLLKTHRLNVPGFQNWCLLWNSNPILFTSKRHRVSHLVTESQIVTDLCNVMRINSLLLVISLLAIIHLCLKYLRLQVILRQSNWIHLCQRKTDQIKPVTVCGSIDKCITWGRLTRTVLGSSPGVDTTMGWRHIQLTSLK